MSEYLEDKKSDILENLLKPLRNTVFENRVHDENNRSRNDGPYQRDYSRIMYASSFRRLQGKMQLIGIKNDQFFRNRLTHSLEVMQIARSIAYNLGYNNSETFVVEAGALSHDIGNPPFGHAGEKYLNEIFKDIGGFEGNAQTLRILTTIERKKPEFQGLNLTYRTLLSVVKYFNKFDLIKYNQEHKGQKFIYNEDYELLNKFIDENNINIRTLDVQIVDIADEIAYAAHDLEDGLRIKAFTIDEILHDFLRKKGKCESYNKLSKLVSKAQEKAGYGNETIDSSEYSKMFRQELSSSIIYELINDIDLINVDYGKKLKTNTMQSAELGYHTYSELASGLKEIVFECINHKNDVYDYEQKGNKVIKFLYEFYSEYDNNKYLPPEYRDKDKDKQKRLICDYISGMMDSYAIGEYEKFSGEKF